MVFKVDRPNLGKEGFLKFPIPFSFFFYCCLEISIYFDSNKR